MVRRIPDLRPALAGVTAPAIVIKPQCDYLPWTFGTDLVDALPNADLVYLRGAGHSLYVERPDEVGGLIEAFLTGEELPIPPITDLAPPPDLDGPAGTEP
jgi:proline iminopeptidase